MLSQFLRLGFSGYKRIIGSCQIVATHLAEKIEALEFFEIKSVLLCSPLLVPIEDVRQIESGSHAMDDCVSSVLAHYFAAYVPRQEPSYGFKSLVLKYNTKRPERVTCTAHP